MFLRHHVATAERRRLFLVAVSLACFLGIIVAAVSRPASMKNDANGGASLAASLVGLSSKNEGPQRFRHILDDLGDSTMGGDGHQPVVDASTLNDLQNELRRLRRPLRVLIHQLEPPATSPPPTRPLPAATGSDDVAPVGGQAIDVPPPLMHRLQFHPRWKRDQTIFVTVIGFMRDGGGDSGDTTPHPCARTVDTLFARATAPDQVHVGAVEVYANDVNLTALPPLGGCVNPAHASCNQSTFCPTDRIRVRRVHEQALGGPQAALTLAASLFRNEQYVLLSTALGSVRRGNTGDAKGVLHLPQGWDSSYITQLNLGRGGRSAITSAAQLGTATVTEGAAAATATLCTLSGSVANTTGAAVRWSVAPGVHAAAAGSSAFASSLLSLDALFLPSAALHHVPMDTNVANAPTTLFELSLAIRLFAQRYTLLQLPRSMQPTWSLPEGACAARCTSTTEDVWSAHVREQDTEYLSNLVRRVAINATESGGLDPRYAVDTHRVEAFWKQLGISPEHVATMMSSGTTIAVDQCKATSGRS